MIVQFLQHMDWTPQSLGVANGEPGGDTPQNTGFSPLLSRREPESGDCRTETCAVFSTKKKKRDKKEGPTDRVPVHIGAMGEKGRVVSACGLRVPVVGHAHRSGLTSTSWFLRTARS